MIAIGSRVRVRAEAVDSYVSPWKKRFSSGRHGTVINRLPDGRWKVLWDTKRKPRYQMEWTLNHRAADLEIVE